MDDKKFQEEVKMLKEWYSKQHHLPQNIDDLFYVNFIWGTSSLEKAKQKIDAYFSLRKYVFTSFEAVSSNTNAQKNVVKSHHVAILPEKTPEGYRVLMKAACSVDPSLYNLSAVYLRNLMLGEIAYSLWPGDSEYIFIFDYALAPLSAVRTLDFRHTIIVITFLMKAVPVKVKGIYIMNVPSIGYKMMSMFQPFLSGKLFSRIHLCHEKFNLKEILPISMIPAEYGGEGKSLKELSDYWADLFNSKQSWFEEQMNVCTDESRRQKDSFARETLDFGLEGTFRKLEID